jgi:ribose-phosphate pyrophosphokinase
MRIYAAPAFAAIAEELRVRAGVDLGTWQARRFANGERYIEVDEAARGAICVALGSIIPPDDHLLTALLLGHTLARAGARRMIAAWPYLAYARQDRDELGRSRAAAWLGAVLPASGIGAVLTVDIHSARAAALLGVPVHDISPAPLWAAEIGRLGWLDACIVAPDAGATGRAEAVRVAAGIAAPVLACEKTRTDAGVTAIFVGEVGARAIIVDDILDTGGTLLACARQLRAAGVREVLVMVTHGLFTGDRWRGLWDLGVTRICRTDSIPAPSGTSDRRIATCAVGPLLADALKEMTHDEPA